MAETKTARGDAAVNHEEVPGAPVGRRSPGDRIRGRISRLTLAPLGGDGTMNGRRAATAALWLALLIAIPAAKADTAKAKAVDPDRFAAVIELLGHLEIDSIGNDMFAMMAERTVPIMRRRVPDLPEGAYALLHEELAAAFRAGTRELIATNARLYAEHLSPEDVTQMNAFYATPAGQKMLKVLPMLMQQSYHMSQEWIQQVNREATRNWTERLKEQGYLK